jgi:hypothetical protein
LAGFSAFVPATGPEPSPEETVGTPRFAMRTFLAVLAGSAAAMDVAMLSQADEAGSAGYNGPFSQAAGTCKAFAVDFNGGVTTKIVAHVSPLCEKPPRKGTERRRAEKRNGGRWRLPRSRTRAAAGPRRRRSPTSPSASAAGRESRVPKRRGLPQDFRAKGVERRVPLLGDDDDVARPVVGPGVARDVRRVAARELPGLRRELRQPAVLGRRRRGFGAVDRRRRVAAILRPAGLLGAAV